MAVKKAVFAAELDRVCKQGAVLSPPTPPTSTSTAIAASNRADRQDDGGPALLHRRPTSRSCIEIVVPAKVPRRRGVATGFELREEAQEGCRVRAGVSDGFIGNRIPAVYRQAADHMMEDGASPYEIGRRRAHFGYPMGPFQVSDLAGGDIGWATRKRRAATATRRPLRAGGRPHLRARLVRPEDAARLTSIPKARAPASPTPRCSRSSTPKRERAGVEPRAFTEEESCAATWPR